MNKIIKLIKKTEDEIIKRMLIFLIIILFSTNKEDLLKVIITFSIIDKILNENNKASI